MDNPDNSQPEASLNPYQPMWMNEPEALPANKIELLDKPWPWPLVFCLNLPIVLCCSVVAVRDGAWLGVTIGVISLLVLGVVCTKLMPRIMRSIQRGGLLTASLQFVPLLQLFAGGYAIEICEDLGLAANLDGTIEPIDSVAGGLTATVLTATPILLVAFWLGFVYSLWKRRIR